MDSKQFRHAMGKFATGVTVITTKTENDIHGMTANAFMSISLDPKLVTISIDNKAKMLDKIKSSNFYAVNLLRDDQVEISMHFAGQKKMNKDVDFELFHGVPVIKEALANIICQVEQTIVVGDHTLFIGAVVDTITNEGEPLTFYGGKYGTYSPIQYISH